MHWDYFRAPFPNLFPTPITAPAISFPHSGLFVFSWGHWLKPGSSAWWRIWSSIGAWRFSQRMYNWRHWLLLSQNLSVPTSLAEKFRGLKALLSWWLTQFCSGPLQVALDAVRSWLPRLCHVQKAAFHSLSPGLHPLNSLCLFFWNVSWTFGRLLLPQPWGPGWPWTCYVAWGFELLIFLPLLPG